jgi:hypothetical protein
VSLACIPDFLCVSSSRASHPYFIVYRGHGVLVGNRGIRSLEPGAAADPPIRRLSILRI